MATDYDEPRKEQADAQAQSLEEAKARAQAGLASTNDVTRVQLEVASAEAELAEATGQAETSRLELGFLLVTSVEGPLAAPEQLLTEASRPVDSFLALADKAEERRPDILSAKLRVQAQEASAREPLARLFPSLGASAQFRFTNEPGFGRANDLFFTVDLSWTLFDGGERYAERRERLALARALELDTRARVRRVDVAVEPSLERERDPRQYVARLAGGAPSTTLDDRYVFAALDYSELRTTLRLNYTLKPDLTLETFLEPFAASGRYARFGQLRAPRSRDLAYYAGDGVVRGGVRLVPTAEGDTLHVPTGIAGEDFTTRALRSNAVLRWEWRPGSTLFAVWQQNRDGYAPAGDASPRTVRLADVGSALRGRRDHVFALKASYWIPASGRR